MNIATDDGTDRRNIALKRSLICMGSFAMTLLILFFLFYISGFAPFGNKSLAGMDANIQYLDFFAYFKNVLQGKDSIAYTFNNNLGGSYFGQFTYYLSSPFSLLVLFFEREELHSFIDIAAALKLGLASATFACFIQIRFKDEIENYIVILLAGSYGLMQYTVSQASNVMWLDGVYMLPLILLGVYKVVETNRIYWLSITVAVSILLNWYTGGINCLFSGIWFIIELFYKGEKERLKKYDVLQVVKWYIFSMFTGVLLSSVLFIPSVAQLRDGVGSGFDWKMLRFGFRGNPLLSMEAYSLGGISTPKGVSLFVGSLPLIGCLNLLFAKAVGLRLRRISAGVLILLLLLFHWKFLFFLFSLLKDASSYWYRYSYLGCFIILFLAAVYFSKWKKLCIGAEQMMTVSAFAGLMLVVSFVKPVKEPVYIYESAATFFLITGMLYGIKRFKSTNLRRLFQVLLFFAVISEIGYNTFLLMNLYSDRNVARFRTYEKEAQEQIEFLQQADKGYYRILQTTTRGNMGTHNITAHYNESVAFDYWGVGGYTSVPKNNQLKFLDRLGYRNEFDRMNIVNTSIVAADSLLGVKYVLSHEDIKGLIPLDEPDAYNKKKIYKNPYALPVAFIYETNNRRIDENSANPFIFTNEWYSKILNREVEVYHRVDFRKSETDKKIIYDMDPVPGKYSLYGNIRWKKTMEAVLHVNGKYKMPYSTWLSQSVFYIPVQEGIAPKVELSVKNDMDIEAEQFYGLNLEELGHISKKIQERKINGVKIENGIVEVKIYGRDDQSLYLSIPYDRGWELTNNRNRVQPEVIGGCMISIPLQNGMNDIRMEYKLPLFREGLGLSILGIFCLIGYGFYGKKYHKNG